MFGVFNFRLGDIRGLQDLGTARDVQEGGGEG